MEKLKDNSEYQIVYSTDLDHNQLLKFTEVKIETTYETQVEKLDLLLIENTMRNSIFQEETIRIIDEDYCEIGVE